MHLLYFGLPVCFIGFFSLGITDKTVENVDNVFFVILSFFAFVLFSLSAMFITYKYQK